MSFSEGISTSPNSLSASTGAADQPPVGEESEECRKEGCGILLISVHTGVPSLHFIRSYTLSKDTPLWHWPGRIPDVIQ